jgi:hypothetical protein
MSSEKLAIKKIDICKVGGPIEPHHGASFDMMIVPLRRCCSNPRKSA